MPIETIINRALALDPNTTRQLKKLHNKCLEVFLEDLEKTFFICFTETDIQFILTKPESPDKCDARVSGPIKAFVNLAITKNPHQSSKLGLSFEGDFNTIEALQKLFLFLDIDWIEATSFFTGDIIAHQCGQFIQDTKTKSVQFLKNSAESISEYLQEESLILPTQIEVNHFMNEVDVLRADVDRLQARLDLLCRESQ